MVELFTLIFNDPMWWIPFLAIPIICCAAVGIKFPKHLWIAPITMMVLGAVSMWFHIPLTDYFSAWAGADVPNRDNEFWGFGLMVWSFWFVYQFFFTLFFTFLTWGLIKLNKYRKRRVTPVSDNNEISMLTV